jgi:phenylacetate-CoA ligase
MKQALSRKNLWEATPPIIRMSAGRLCSFIPPDLVLGRRFRQALRRVREAQWWPAERSREYQLERVRRVCTLAYENSRFYRRSFDEAGFHRGDLKRLEDLRGLPTIDKATVRDHLKEMAVRPTGGWDVEYVATGGTTGTPTHFYVGRDRSAVEYAYLVSSWERTGYRMNLPQAVFRGRTVKEDRGGLRHEYDPLLRRHYYSTFHLADETMGRYLDHISTLGQCYLHVYPSATVTLAHFCERYGQQAPSNILGILAGSETIRKGDRELIERVFKVRLYSWYGHSEKLVLAAECERSSDYHIWPTYGYFELLDESGRPVTTPGERGEIVGTGFINTVVPFIRYRTGDYAVYLGEGCHECGREHLRIGTVEGHGQEGLVGRDGQPIAVTTLLRAAHAGNMMSVQRYQFYQDRRGVAEFRVVLSAGATREEAEALAESLALRTERQLALSVRVVSEIALTKSGKYKLVDGPLAVALASGAPGSTKSMARAGPGMAAPLGSEPA